MSSLRSILDGERSSSQVFNEVSPNIAKTQLQITLAAAVRIVKFNMIIYLLHQSVKCAQTKCKVHYQHSHTDLHVNVLTFTLTYTGLRSASIICGEKLLYTWIEQYQLMDNVHACN